MPKIFFQIQKVVKICKKNLCADEADVEQQEIREVAIISYNVLQEVS